MFSPSVFNQFICPFLDIFFLVYVLVGNSTQLITGMISKANFIYIYIKFQGNIYKLDDKINFKIIILRD